MAPKANTPDEKQYRQQCKTHFRTPHQALPDTSVTLTEYSGLSFRGVECSDEENSTPSLQRRKNAHVSVRQLVDSEPDGVPLVFGVCGVFIQFSQIDSINHRPSNIEHPADAKEDFANVTVAR